MKEKWMAPRTVIEEFTPNEYVAVCWGVGCSVTEANIYEQTNYAYGHTTWASLGCTHDAAHCGFQSNQVIHDYNDDGIGDEMTEIGTDGLGTLKCTIYSDANYRHTLSVSSVKPGMNIYWTTSSGSRTWHHVGKVYATNPAKPNAS